MSGDAPCGLWICWLLPSCFLLYFSFRARLCDIAISATSHAGLFCCPRYASGPGSLSVPHVHYHRHGGGLVGNGVIDP
jgi:hypothetical protein